MAKSYGRWEILKSLDEGGQGLLYLVRDGTQGSSDSSAVFVLKRLKNTTGPRLERFKREVELLYSVDHPNVVKLRDAAPDATPPYYVLDYYPRGSVRKAIQSIRQNSPEAIELFAAVCDGLAAAHAKGIIHRDIKPDNILLTDNGPVVADFGICYVHDEERLTETAEAVGPRHFMAPELAHGIADEETITTRCDVYSLGKLLYFMLTGQSFDREVFRLPRFDLVKKFGDDRFERVNRLLDRMIVEDPSGRVDDVAAVARAARDISRLIRGNYAVVTPTGGQVCRFCGEGHYQARGGGGHSAEDFLGLTRYSGQEYRALVCDQCGHLELFRIEKAAHRKDWWGAQ